MSTMQGPLEHLGDRCRAGSLTLTYQPWPPLGDVDEGLVASVHLVPFVGDQAVVSRVEDQWIIPGGTLEPGEHWRDAAARELLEEAGARLRDVTPFAVLRCHDDGPTPYRAHLPWPDFLWIVGWAEVELVGPPTCPPGGECVVDVRVTTVEEAARLVGACAVPLLGDLYRLAARCRANCCTRPRPPAPRCSSGDGD
jgi:8-oxo-dGTP diphosphatase